MQADTTLQNTDKQAEREDEIESDLYTVFVSAKRLVASGTLPWRLEMALEYAARAIQGCAVCKRSLGSLHGPACVSVQGYTVADHDLSPDLKEPYDPRNDDVRF